MSTRSMIAVEQPDKTILATYCHNDGYLTGVGAELLETRPDYESALALVQGGDMSWCDGKNHYNDDSPARLYTNRATYARMYRGDVHIEYYYLFAKGKWWYHEMESFRWLPLSPALVLKRLRDD